MNITTNPASPFMRFVYPNAVGSCSAPEIESRKGANETEYIPIPKPDRILCTKN